MVAVEVPPSPNVHARDAMVPSLSVELSVNVAVRPLVAEPKFATGATLPPPPPHPANLKLPMRVFQLKLPFAA